MNWFIVHLLLDLKTIRWLPIMNDHAHADDAISLKTVGFSFFLTPFSRSANFVLNLDILR